MSLVNNLKIKIGIVKNTIVDPFKASLNLSDTLLVGLKRNGPNAHVIRVKIGKQNPIKVSGLNIIKTKGNNKVPNLIEGLFLL